MKIIQTAVAFSQWQCTQTKTIGFIPTLGALHRGHLSLVVLSKQTCKLTVVSIFLNPTQFAPDEDFNSYPHTLDDDINMLENLDVDVLFLPSVKEMYNKVEDVKVPHTPLFDKLEGASRPHFFYGVTTIVAKLFNVIKPTHAFFGQKDAQQFYIIKQMIENMNYPIQLIAGSTIRNQEGLALSSRNQYLTAGQQTKASIIYSSLMDIKDALDQGEKDPKILKKSYKSMLKKIEKMKIDYISIACINTLDEVEIIETSRLLISTAVLYNNVRLIDNFIYQSST